MKAAQWIFRIAGIWGVLVILPLYFLEDVMNQQFPPAMNHPEMYYGFIGVGLAWQVAFLIISTDPVRYRPLMIAAMLEKFTYVGALVTLLAKGRAPAMVLGAAIPDGCLGLLFVLAWIKTKE